MGRFHVCIRVVVLRVVNSSSAVYFRYVNRRFFKPILQSDENAQIFTGEVLARFKSGICASCKVLSLALEVSIVSW